jgi:hypothetical protein
LAGVAGVGASLFTRPASAAAVVELRSSELGVRFDPNHAAPVSYEYRGYRVAGAEPHTPVKAILCRLAPRAYATVEFAVGPARSAPGAVGSPGAVSVDVAFGPPQSAPGPVAVSQDGEVRARFAQIDRVMGFGLSVDKVVEQPAPFGVAFPCTVSHEGAVRARFDQVYRLKGASLTLTLENVVEQPGYELIEIALPRLVAMNEAEPQAWMAEGRDGGSFVRLADAKSVRLDDDDNFGRISIQLPIGLVGAGDVGCLMEVQGYMDGTETEISGLPGARLATLGTDQVYRVHGGRCYNMGDGGDPVCGTPTTPNLLVGQTPTTRLDFFTVTNPDQPWLDGAKLLAARMPTPPDRSYGDKLPYIIAGKNKTEDKPRSTFAQSAALIAKVARLTDQAPQIAYISGWVYDGQDTGYPSEDKVNESLGTYEELRALMARGRTEWNADVTINVNYDDAYKSSPIFDPAFIARRPDGAIWASKAWDGDTSYIVGMAKFMTGGWGPRRIRYTVDRYQIKGPMLVDAMSWFAIRNDWDPAHPASGYKNLVDGKFALVDQARALGVDIASEQLRYPFIGRLSLTMNGPTFSKCPFGGDAIPLAATVYRGAAIWGDDGASAFDPGPNLFWNNRSSQWYQGDSDPMRIAEFYFLIVLPFSKLHDLPVEDYSHQGGVRRLKLKGGAEITLADDGKAYAAAWNGATISKSGTTTCPIDADRIAFFAREAETLTYPLPPDWRSGEVVAKALSLEGPQFHSVAIEAGSIVVAIAARTPVIVYRNAAAAGAGPGRPT